MIALVIFLFVLLYAVIGGSVGYWFVWLGLRSVYGLSSSMWVSDREDALFFFGIGLFLWPLMFPLVAIYQVLRTGIKSFGDYLLTIAPKDEVKK